MTTSSILVRVCIWILSAYKLEFSLSRVRLNHVLFCLFVFDAILELHAMDEKMFNDFFNEKWKWSLYVIKAYLIHDLCFVYLVEAFYHIETEKLTTNIWVHFLACY
jgi:hypothetical protein